MLALLLLASALDHGAWDGLLKKYVTADSRVDYARWKSDGTAALDEYLARAAEPFGESKAAWINVYNATVIRWVLRHYPVESIWRTPKPFKDKRHRVNGTAMSLDEMEGKLRATKDPRIHAALVCAARSCPPLRREAYVDERIDAQLDDNSRAWLANAALNRFDAATKTSHISSIFKWYKDDFPALDEFLIRHGAHMRGWKIQHLDYHWGLNDAGPMGAKYSGFSLARDWLKNQF